MARGRVFSSCPQRLNAQVPKKCCQLGTKQQMKTGWVILFQITRWHAPMVCNAWGCSLIVNSGPSGLLHAKTGAGSRDFADSGTAHADSGTDHGCKPMQPRASLLLPTNACPWQPWVKLMLGQSQMHTGCSKTTQEPSKCMQIAPNVVTLFTIGKV